MGNHKERLILEWYEQFGRELFRFVWIMLGSKEGCDDIVHDTFLKAWSAMDRFEEKSSVKTWLFAIARHQVLDEIRRRKKRRIFLGRLAESHIPSGLDVQRVVELREEVKELLEQIQELKPNYRIVIILSKVEECSSKEIAEILGWSEVKVRKTVSRAIQVLRKENRLKGGDGIERSI
ncbi:RNA polymerase sigma factor [Bacillus infantis]|uniref:RNA polymerase sigma factor n=1 Tax=Bacillus infantis TaxID=324767 RepID=UPI0021558D99|nr:RNA polymerase sigma factor [Bacillus infantis]